MGVVHRRDLLHPGWPHRPLRLPWRRLWQAGISGAAGHVHTQVGPIHARCTLSSNLFKHALANGKRAIRTYVRSDVSYGPGHVAPRVPAGKLRRIGFRFAETCLDPVTGRCLYSEEQYVRRYTGTERIFVRMTRIIAPERPSLDVNAAGFDAKCDELARRALADNWWGLWRLLPRTQPIQPNDGEVFVTDVMNEGTDNIRSPLEDRVYELSGAIQQIRPDKPLEQVVQWAYLSVTCPLLGVGERSEGALRGTSTQTTWGPCPWMLFWRMCSRAWSRRDPRQGRRDRWQMGNTRRHKKGKTHNTPIMSTPTGHLKAYVPYLTVNEYRFQVASSESPLACIRPLARARGWSRARASPLLPVIHP